MAKINSLDKNVAKNGYHDSSALFSERVGDVSIRLMLDIRNRKLKNPQDDAFPLCIRFVMDGKRTYYRLGEQFTEEELKAIRLSTGHGEKIVEGKETRFQTKMRLNSVFMTHVQMVRKLDDTGTLTLPRIMTALTGKSSNSSLVEFWQNIINYKREHGQASTALSYMNALKSFVEHTKFKAKDGFNVDSTTVRKWHNGLLKKGISDATIGIYFRALRYIINECIAEGYMQPKDRMFGKDVKRSEKIAIPVGKSRKERHISIEKMTELYHYWKMHNLPLPRYEIGKHNPSFAIKADTDMKNIYQSLAMFLIQYLGCGANLFDIALMRYDDFYFQNNGEALHFFRQKTKNTSNDGSGTEVIIPIIAPVREILDTYGAKPEKGELVFPFIMGDSINDTDAVQVERVKQGNHNIGDRMKKIAACLGWEEALSSTWARHSFATNLHTVEVPKDYISFAMGHTTGNRGDITDRYIYPYTIEKMKQYNNHLLKGLVEEDTTDNDDDMADMMEMLKDVSKEDFMKALLKVQSDKLRKLQKGEKI